MMISLIIFSITLPNFTFVYADEIDSENQNAISSEQAIISAEKDQEVPLYEEMDEDSEVLTTLYDEDVVTILEEFETFSLIEYSEEETEEVNVEDKIWQGYVSNEYLEQSGDDLSAPEGDPNQQTEGDTTEGTGDESGKEVNTEDGNDKVKSTEDGNSINKTTRHADSVGKSSNEDKPENVEINITSLNNGTFNGIALKDKTIVYEKQSRDSKALKKYSKGSILKYRGLNDNWYEATVSVNGKWVKGYIHTDDVENAVKDQKTVRGVALKSNTHVYKSASTSSKSLKSYKQGTLLKYKTYTSDWYEATVKVNGDWKTGYIHKTHVEEPTRNQETFRGIALKSNTHVYAKPSTSSKKLKSYSQGSLLKYQTYTSDWYEATVKVNGKWVTGYIHKTHVEEPLKKQETLNGIASKSSTHVYKKASTTSGSWKSYSQGTLLKYKTYTSDWYEATVYVKGKKQTGYIHKSHVEEPTSNQETLHGISLKSKTHVYAKPSTTSKRLKSYKIGKKLKYKTYTKNWYEATVKVKGKWETGYIHKSHVDELVDTNKTLQGIGLKNKTHVYSEASTSAKKLKSYAQGTLLKYKAFSKNWYEATVKVNGKWRTGYIHKSHVEEPVNKQKTLHGIALKSKTHIYAKASTSSKKLKSYNQGTVLKYKTFTNSWYEATVYINGKKYTGYINKSDVITSNNKTVVIDAGHGGSDPGASGNGLYEKELTLEIAQKVKKLLQSAGFKVIMTRSNDTYVSLEERSSIANNSNADIFVSIHINAGGGTGIETYWYGKHEPEKSKALATALQEEVIKGTNSVDRGVKGSIDGKKGNFHVIRETEVPSALIELGFIDNKNDAEKLKQTSFKEKIVKGIVDGIKKFFRLY